MFWHGQVDAHLDSGSPFPLSGIVSRPPVRVNYTRRDAFQFLAAAAPNAAPVSAAKALPVVHCMITAGDPGTTVADQQHAHSTARNQPAPINDVRHIPHLRIHFLADVTANSRCTSPIRNGAAGRDRAVADQK
jgi:hypothetical protein